MKRLFILLSLFGLFPSMSYGVDLQWSGRYRIEGNYIRNPTLDKNAGIQDSYITNHLILEPKIIATDGVTIKSRFDVFNNAIGNNQIGQVFGSYGPPVGSATPPPNPSGVLSHTQNDETFVATQLYLSWVNEFSALVVGRVPFHFGLGMLYSSGAGLYDHFFSTKDIVSYKMVWGNISLMPAYGKERAGNLNLQEDVNDYIVVAEYSNPETNMSMGVLFDARVAPIGTIPGQQGDDFQIPTATGSNLAGTYSDGFSAYNMNFFAKKQSDNWNVGGELGFITGRTGLQLNNANADKVSLSGFGLALEGNYKAGNYTWGLHTGIASGPDSDNPSNFAGYFFSPNYRVAMLMFSHVLGQYDVLRSTFAGTRPANGALSGLDTETISNAIYVAPSVDYALSEKYDLLGTICYATLNKAPVVTAQWQRSNSLGFETDLGLNYHPNDKFSWVTSLGFFFPGGAFGGPTSLGFAYPTDLAYGATTKAAINF